MAGGGLIQPGASTAPVHIPGIFALTVTKVTPHSAVGTLVTIEGGTRAAMQGPVIRRRTGPTS